MKEGRKPCILLQQAKKQTQKVSRGLPVWGFGTFNNEVDRKEKLL